MNISPNEIRQRIEEITRFGKDEVKKIIVLVADYDGDNWEVTVELTTDKLGDNDFTIDVEAFGNDLESAEFKAHRISKQLNEYEGLTYEIAR